MDKKTIKKIGIVVAVIGGLFFIFTFFSKGDDAGDLLVRSKVDTLESAIVEDLFSILRDLSQLKIDRSIFEDEVFRSLVDYTVVVSARPQGRINPFLPIEE